MANEKVKEILEKLMADPKAKELLKNLPPAKNEGEMIASIIGVAKELGYALTEADLKDYADAAVADRKEKTEAQAQEIQKLDDSELEKAAGGGNSDCKYSYSDRENCYRTDGCDMNYEIYKTYLCDHNHNGKACGTLDQMACQQLIYVPCRE